MSINDNIAVASKGLADHIVINFKTPSVVIGFNSDDSFNRYAPMTAGIFAANGVKVFLFKSKTSSDAVSEKIRQDNLSAGLFIITGKEDKDGFSFEIKGLEKPEIIYPDSADEVRIGDYKAGIQAGCISLI